MTDSPTIGGVSEAPLDNEALFKLAYAELHAVSSRYLRKERPGHTLQTTALLHEAFVRLLGIPHASWPNLTAFCAAMATAMRRVLVDYARTRERKKRGGKCAERIALGTAHLLVNDNSLDLLALDRALDELAARDPRACRIIELRFFGGLTEQQTAEELRLSRRTVTNTWKFARAWLRERLENDGVSP